MARRRLFTYLTPLLALAALIAADASEASPPQLDGDSVIESARGRSRRFRSKKRPRKSPLGMARVSAGPFWMGCHSEKDPHCKPEEYPLHEVELSAFAIDRNEITVYQYAGCVLAGQCPAPIAKDPAHPVYKDCTFDAKSPSRQPVNCLSWGQANLYCQWKGKRLPTEAEWEKAARWTDARVYPWGNEPAPSCDRVVMNNTTTGGGGPGCERGEAWVIGKPKGASPYEALSMAGNLREWVWDIYDPAYYLDSPRRNPVGPPRLRNFGTEDTNPPPRVVKGGGYMDRTAGSFRLSRRGHYSPTYASPSLGFRCVIDLR